MAVVGCIPGCINRTGDGFNDFLGNRRLEMYCRQEAGGNGGKRWHKKTASEKNAAEYSRSETLASILCAYCLLLKTQ